MTEVTGVAGSLGRAEVTLAIATTLGIDPPGVGAGSTVQSEFLTRIIEAIGDDPTLFGSTYRKLEHALGTFDEVYDPLVDSSEGRGRTGGGTITNAGYRKLLRGITGEPRCFILNVSEDISSARYGDVTGKFYGYDPSVSGSRALTEAGTGSRVVFYRTGNAPGLPKRAFVAKAEVAGIEGVAPGTRRANLSGFRELVRAVPESEVKISGWNHRNAITEISGETFRALLANDAETPVTVSERHEEASVTPLSVGTTTPPRILNQADIDKLLASAGPVDAPLDLSGRADPLPDILPTPTGTPAPDLLASLPEDRIISTVSGSAARVGLRLIDSFVEQRAVFIAQQYMEENGWTLSRDCQSLGIGYDLEFTKASQRRHVEVKGIGQSVLSFNLTALEWRRVLSDPELSSNRRNEYLGSQFHTCSRPHL